MNDGEPLTVELGAVDSADALALFRQLDAELNARYPGVPLHPFHASEVADGRGAFVIARVGGRPVGCAAVRPLAPGVGEVKRVYVDPTVRGRGVGRHLLVRVEAAARGLGFAVLRLETGTRQPEAIRLFEAVGYRLIPRFGEYLDDSYSVCFEKRLK